MQSASRHSLGHATSMKPSDTFQDLLLSLIVEMKQIVDTHATEIAIRASSDPSIPEQIEVRKRSLLAEIQEAVTILSMTQEVIAVLREVQAGMRELYPQVPAGPIDQSTDAGRRFRELMTLQFKFMPRLVVLIKALYEWIYHLSELLDTPQMQDLLTDHLRSRLQAYCAFRNKLVAHQQYAEVDRMRGMMRFSGDFSSIELMLTPFTPPGAASKELDTLFPQCSDKLTDEERKEENFFERCRILANALDRFRDDRRGRIISFMERYGAISDTPIRIAQFLRDFVREVVPQLM